MEFKIKKFPLPLQKLLLKARYTLGILLKYFFLGLFVKIPPPPVFAKMPLPCPRAKHPSIWIFSYYAPSNSKKLQIPMKHFIKVEFFHFVRSLYYIDPFFIKKTLFESQSQNYGGLSLKK